MIKRNASKRELEQRIEQFSLAFAQLPDSTLVTDANFNIVSINRPFEKLYGYSLEDVLGQKPDMLNAEPMAKAIQKDIYDTIVSDIWRGSASNVRKDGSTFINEMTISALTDEQGTPFAYVGTQKDITKQKQAESALRERDKELNGLLDLGKLVEEAENLEELLPRFAKEIVPKSVQFSDKAHVGLEFDGEHYVTCHQHKPGNIPYNLNAPITVFGKERGKLTIGYLEDLHFLEPFEPIFVEGCARRLGRFIERKETEKTLKESEQKYRRLLKNSPNIPYQFLMKQDGDLSFPYIGDNSFSVFGVEAESVMADAKNLLTLIDKDYVEKFQSKMIESATTLQMFNYTVKTTINEETKYMEARSTPEKQPDGSILWDGFMIDVTKQKKAENEIKNRTQLLETILDNSLVGFAINKIDTGEVIYVSSAFLEAYNVSRVDCKTVTGFFKTVYGNRMEEIGQKIIDDVLSEDITRMKWQDVLMTDEQGNTTYITAMNLLLKEQNLMISTVLDTTEQKQAEKSMIEAERLGAIGELASGIAHDFNNSLQAIFGSIEMALLSPDPEEKDYYMRVAKDSAVDAVSSVQQLQRFAGKRVESSIYEVVSINSVIDDTIAQTRNLWKDEAQKNGLSISLNTDYQDDLNTFGNKGELRTVFYNVIRNSVQAMPEGGTIDISTKKDEKNLYVTVTDSGTGMDDETQKKIFDPFYTTKGFEQGKGLGMNRAYTIINEHEGEIYVISSESGKGTTLEIKLPYTKQKSASEEQAKEYEGSASVLWVDDEDMIRNMGKALLSRLGHEVDVASSGQEALELLAKNEYDLMITDVGMPNMSGWQLAEAIKGKYLGMKVAVVTGWGNDVKPEQKKQYGVGYVLGKPVDKQTINNLVGEVLQMKSK